MTKLIYCMLTSLDGYTEDALGRFDWGISEDEPVLAYINELGASIGTYLYGRRIYETMLYWENAPIGADQSAVERDFTLQWQSARKFVYSRTLTEPRSARTWIERTFDVEAIRRLKVESTHDISVSGPGLAAQALAAGLVDEIHPIVCPVVVGGGKRFLPDGIQLDLRLLESRSFESGQLLADRARGIHQRRERCEIAGAGMQPQQVEPDPLERGDTLAELRRCRLLPRGKHRGLGRSRRHERRDHLRRGAPRWRASHTPARLFQRRSRIPACHHRLMPLGMNCTSSELLTAPKASAVCSSRNPTRDLASVRG